MARFFQTLTPSTDGSRQVREDGTQPDDDDVALGCECADPSLQFEAWEPAQASQQAAAPGY